MMKLFAFACLLSACFAAGCNSNSGTAVNANVSTAASNRSDGGTSASAAPSSNAAAPGIPSEPATTNAPAAPSTGGLSADNGRPIAEGPPPAERPKGVIAPDNSIVTTTGGGEGGFVETRVFKNDPVVDKLEKSTNGDIQSAKVYLKNGKTVSVAASDIGLINSIPLSEIKRLAGVAGKAETAAPAGEAPASKPRK